MNWVKVLEGWAQWPDNRLVCCRLDVYWEVGQEQKFAYARSFGYDQVFLREGFVEAVQVAHQQMESATNTGKILLQVQS